MENIQESLYGTHIEALRWAINKFKPATVLEFGLGPHSTPFFLENGCYLTSVEEQSEEWLKKVKKNINNDKWLPLLELEAISYNSNTIREHYDLVFIDGHHQRRAPHLAHFVGQKHPLIIVHDFEKKRFYNWRSVVIPPCYITKIFDYKGKQTAVFYLK